MRQGALLLLALVIAPSAWAEERQIFADYPRKAHKEGREGIVTYRVLVGKDGRVKSCSIEQSSGWDDLDKATCKNMKKRARFSPASDAQGHPIEVPFISKWHWRIKQPGAQSINTVQQ